MRADDSTFICSAFKRSLLRPHNNQEENTSGPSQDWICAYMLDYFDSLKSLLFMEEQAIILSP